MAYGRRPSQASMDTVFAQTTAIAFYPHPSHQTPHRWCTDRSQIASLSWVIRIHEPSQPGFAVLSLGDYALACHAKNTLLATFSIDASGSLRCSRWNSDAWLCDRVGLDAWRETQGWEAEMETGWVVSSQGALFDRWWHSVPPCLREQRPLVVRYSQSNRQQMQTLLKTAYPHPSAYFSELFCWFGAGTGNWEDFPPYETLPCDLLLLEDSAPLLAYLTAPILPLHNLRGIARFLCTIPLSQAQTLIQCLPFHRVQALDQYICHWLGSSMQRQFHLRFGSFLKHSDMHQ
ncbi:hypothetical protein [Herpetosiphon gulosus]|uniref:Uncharacterized protein n=1 Tax=Herpetosiphon gulosus TaxID=1973496 RepID=A0ABP9X7A7_9CHLR